MPVEPKARQQVKALESLSQPAAAWLLGCTARHLRDQTSAPRNDDGTYDAQKLVEWSAGRARAPELDDEEYETALVIADRLCVGDSYTGVVTWLRGLREKYGDAGLIAFVDLLMNEWAELAVGGRFPTTADLERAAEEARQGLIRAHNEVNLRFAYVCEKCKRLRRGRRWIQSKPPEGHVVIGDSCPACLK